MRMTEYMNLEPLFMLAKSIAGSRPEIKEPFHSSHLTP